MKKLLRKIINKKQKDIEYYSAKNYSQRENPQIIEMRLRMEGELSAYTNVLEYLNGNKFYLHIAKGE